MEKQEVSFERSLTLTHLVLFGLAYLAPMIVFGIYGTVAEVTHGLEASAYLVALIAMFFTAFSYTHMVKAYPVAGSAYTYTRKSLNSHLGFMVGWATLLDYVFIPMAIWLIGSAYLNAAFPSVPSWLWILLFIFVTTAINILGIKLSTKVNFLMMVFQFLVIALFIILSIKSVLGGGGAGTLLSVSPFVNTHVSFSFVLAGASIACYSFLGFDAISTFTEETRNPEKTIPRAIILTTVIGGLIFVVSTYFTHLAHPDFTHFKAVDSAGFEIAKQIGGNLFSAIFLAGIIIAQFASGISAQASASRLLYAMGRDSVLPKKIFGYLHPKFKTPVLNILVVAVIGLLSLKLSVSTSTSFINFGAFIAFILVNVSVIAHFYIKGGKRTGKEKIFYLLFPAIGCCFDIWLFVNLDKNALILGGTWAVIGFVYLLVLTKMFKKQPPEMHFEEMDEAV
ncbi:APC family permease [Bacillus salipaludis]|uniref:APC family permease n=1 Tax=Bacillus salipaludis TaxID=2547811 RepID=A0A4R5VMW5_9BACI|nr:APC family permease [Bacillus salipaludis]MDQ6595712.1 APC family permease [Bacillus salipaludis]TDK58656.1 APC family permease [Bacillus salipaludis]